MENTQTHLHEPSNEGARASIKRKLTPEATLPASVLNTHHSVMAQIAYDFVNVNLLSVSIPVGFW